MLKKDPHQLGQNCAFMHNCYSSRAYMHGYCSMCISYFILFFSLTLSSSLYPSDSQLFCFLNRSLLLSIPLTLNSFVFSIGSEWQTLSTLSFSHLIPLASMIADCHQSLAATTTDCHHHRSLISPPISNLSTDLIAFLYFWLFDQWVSG